MARKTKTCTCGEKSLPGLAGEHPPCQYHWNAGNWGKAWADQVRDQAAGKK